MKPNKLLIILVVLCAASIIINGLALYRNQQLQKQVSNLYSNIDDLDDKLSDAKKQIEELEGKKEEMEEKLSRVQHFDNAGTSYYSGGSSGVSYTGSAMQTKIDGTFEGWDGETIFKMMNGTVWQQASYSYTYHYAYMPDVLIYSKGGTYYMKVEDVDEEIAVKQIK